MAFNACSRMRRFKRESSSDLSSILERSIIRRSDTSNKSSSGLKGEARNRPDFSAQSIAYEKSAILPANALMLQRLNGTSSMTQISLEKYGQSVVPNWYLRGLPSLGNMLGNRSSGSERSKSNGITNRRASWRSSGSPVDG